MLCPVLCDIRVTKLISFSQRVVYSVYFHRLCPLLCMCGAHTVESKSLEVSAFGWQGENRFDPRVRLLQNAERK